MSYTVTIKDNDTGKINLYETNVEAIIASYTSRHDDLRCSTTNIAMCKGKNLTLASAYKGIKNLTQELPKQHEFLKYSEFLLKGHAFNTPEEMEAAIANDSTAAELSKAD